MKKAYSKTAIALMVIGAGLAAMPAQAVQTTFASPLSTLTPVAISGTNALGDLWESYNGPANINSNFGMSDHNATPQTFNHLNINNSNGTYATSFQLTMNKSQDAIGFKGLIQGPVSSGLSTSFIVKPDLADASTWISWIRTYNLMDSGSGLYQQVLFTAPIGGKLNQGDYFNVDVNFAGLLTPDAGWAASFDDRALQSNVPEPGSLALMGLGLVGLISVFRRKQS
jgi:hypothetical protein